MKGNHRLDVILIRALRFFIGLLMIAAVLVNFSNVVARYVFSQPFVWAEETMQFMHIWAVWKIT